MTVTYLDHSGFAVTLPDAILVFDYYRDPSNSLKHILHRHPSLPVIFLVSHHHPDHFNNEIFDLAQDHERMFVLSDDIYAKLVPDKGLSVAWLKGGDPEIALAAGLTVKAYGSTDAGVSYAVRRPSGEVIFHAGDLNDWHWQDESTHEEVARADESFKVIVNRIAAEIPAMNIVMFPVDTRLGSDFSRGAHIFTEKIKVAHFFPMHFWKDHEAACDFSQYIATPEYTKAYCLDRPGREAKVD